MTVLPPTISDPIQDTGTFHICSRCKRCLPKSAFNKASNRPSGVQSFCRKCDTEYRREYRKKNKKYGKR